MKMKHSLAVFGTLSLALLGGCSSLKTVNVIQDPALSGASVAVDVVAVNEQNKALETLAVREYWRNPSGVRGNGAFTTLRFGQGQPNEQTVTKNWQSGGAKKVLVIADLPGVFADGVGSSDPRRRLIPVQKAAVVTIRVTPSGLSVDSTK